MLLKRAFSSACQSFSRQLALRPAATQALACGGLWAGGDVIAQRIEGYKEVHWLRLGLTTLYGGALVTPIQDFWYRGLDHTFIQRCKWPAHSPRFVAAKVAADTLVFTPVLVWGFFGFCCTLEGASWQDFQAKCRTDFWPTLVAETVIWPPFSCLNFALTPLPYQLLVNNLATVVDSAFLCWARTQDDWMSCVVPVVERPGATPIAVPGNVCDPEGGQAIAGMAACGGSGVVPAAK